MELTLILGISVFGLLFAVYLINNVLRRDTGTPQMREYRCWVRGGGRAIG